MGKISAASLMARGSNIAKKHPKAKSPDVAKDFPKGMEMFAEAMAVKFVKYVGERIENEYELPVLEIKVNKQELLRSISQKKGIVTIYKGTLYDYSYWEIWRYFEYGRLDMGVLPDPILKKIFIEFKDIYKEELEKHLDEKRNKK